MSQSIAIGSDHGGLDLKNEVRSFLEKRGFSVVDCGAHSTDSVDYPDFADAVVSSIKDGQAELGVLVCGTGIGISIKANRHKGIRAAVVHSEFTAEMAKAHNNANILCLGQRTTETKDALNYVEKWLSAEFEGGRHQRRLDKLDV